MMYIPNGDCGFLVAAAAPAPCWSAASAAVVGSKSHADPDIEFCSCSWRRRWQTVLTCAASCTGPWWTTSR